MVRAAVVGATSWGTTLATLLAKQGATTTLWARTAQEAKTLAESRVSATKPAAHTVPKEVSVTPDIVEALSKAELVIFAVPSRSLRENLRRVKMALSPTSVFLSAVKGLEKDTGKRMSEVILEELPAECQSQVAVLSGPNLSGEIAQGKPASTVIASYDEKVGDWIQKVMNSRLLRVYTNPDVVGVELGGALKNIIAIGAGICDGIGYGANAKAAFVTRGLAEITRLGVALGASPLTFAGLAGLGDLVATCFSSLSRNRQVGEELGKGRRLSSILASLGQVAEGVDTTAAALVLATRYQVEMPIAQATYRLLFEELAPQQAAMELLSRAPGPEWPSNLAR